MTFDDMVGKMIVDVRRMKPKEYEDYGFLRIKFSDGTHVVIAAGYGEHNNNSMGEYPTWLYLLTKLGEKDHKLRVVKETT